MVLFIFLISCEKEEIPVQPKPDNGFIKGIGDLGQDYGDQIFYDLNTNTIVHQQSKFIFDLNINMHDSNDYIYLNSAKGMEVDFISGGNFNDNIVLSDLNLFADSPSGDLDSNVIGEWWNKDGIFVAHRGYSTSGANLGYFKFKPKKEGNNIKLLFSQLDGSQLDSVVFIKDNTYNFKGFSYDSKQVVNTEPAKNSWDILLTQYTHIFPDSTTYLVTGVLLNPRKTAAAILLTDFETTNLQDALTHSFIWKEDLLGYNWKWYNYDEAVYEIVESNQYLVRSQTGTIFKLKFTDFYNQQGEKGAINFDFLPL